MLKFCVSDGIEQAYVTLFDKSEVLVGCSPKKYIQSVTEVCKSILNYYMA